MGFTFSTSVDVVAIEVFLEFAGHGGIRVIFCYLLYFFGNTGGL